MKRQKKTTYSNKFNKAFESLMLLEGGYSNETLDSGKETKYGICKKSHPHVPQRLLDSQFLCD
jgi:hypothetical protein